YHFRSLHCPKEMPTSAALVNEDPSSITAVFRGGEMLPGASITSPVYRIDGFPWRWRVTRRREPLDNFYDVFLVCAAGREFELWTFEAAVATTTVNASTGRKLTSTGKHNFVSWEPESHAVNVTQYEHIPVGIAVSYTITVRVDVDCERFTRRPSAFALLGMADVILVVEDQKFAVNKQVLAAESPYFDCLFFGSFREANEHEIELKGIDSEDFHELLRMVVGRSSEPSTGANAVKFLMMADMFDLKIVIDRMENFLLSANHISFRHKILLAEEYRLQTVKDYYCPKTKSFQE
ncbi:hypothetical protein PRIPAC_93080, partial [Pristionchus pacificus]